MLYDMITNSGFLGTFETNESPQSVLKCLEACYGNVVLIEHKKETFDNKFYVYRYVNGDFRNVELLGIFETSMSLQKAWDIMFQVFKKDTDGIFVRKEKIC